MNALTFPIRIILLAAALCALMLFAAPAAPAAHAQQGEGERRGRGSALERLLESLEERESAPAQAATSAPAQPQEQAPQPQPPQEEAPATTTPPPTAEPPAAEDPAGAAPQEPIAPASGSADPAVLAAQNSKPTAGAGGVYRGNALPVEATQALLAVALALGVGGTLLCGRPRSAALAEALWAQEPRARRA